jgi:hypothetical protein
MERRNVMIDDKTMRAADWLKEVYSLGSTSAALRYAVRELALQTGWQSEQRPPKPKRRQQAGAGREEGE